MRQGVRDGIDDMQEAGMPAIVADLGRSVFPAIPEQTSSSSISGDEASAGDDTAVDSTLESLSEEFDFDDKLVEFKDDLNPNLVRDLEDENGVCDEADENGSCSVEEDHDDVEYAEDEEAEEDEEFDEEEFFENDDGGDDEEEEVDDNDDGTNGDGTYDPRSEREQLQDPQFDQFEWVGHRGGRGSSDYKFDLREGRRGGLSKTDRLLYCKSNGATNKQVAINIAADQGQKLRTEVTHRYSMGVAVGRGSKGWARAQTHGESATSLNLMLGAKRVFDERINLAEGWSSYPFDVRILGWYMDFGMIEQDLESLELRPGPILKCVWATGLKSYTLADDVTFSMDVAFAAGRPNTDNNIMKCAFGVDRMKNVLEYNGLSWARKEYGLVEPQVALAQFHAFLRI